MPSNSPSSRFQSALTRRTLMAGAALAAFAPTRGLAQTTPATPATTRDVETDKGIVTVPFRAERVVCADFYGAFAVVDLGIVPIGAGGLGFSPTGEPYATLLADVPSIGDWTNPDLEKVLAAEPDLILRTIDTQDDLYQLLSAIAPTAVLSFQSLSLPEVAVRVGEVLGREEEAATLLKQYESLCGELAVQHAEVLESTTFSYVMSASESSFWTMGPTWTDTTVMLDAGLKLAEPSASQTDQVTEYSMEELGLLVDSDVILINADSDGRTPAPDTEILTESPLWASIPAVAAGNVFAIPYGAASLGAGIVLVERLGEILNELAAQSS